MLQPPTPLSPHFGHSFATTASYLSPEDSSIELNRLCKDLKYRELFKKSPKSQFKGFNHFFLSQELDSAERGELDGISEDTSSTITDEERSSSVRKSKGPHGHFHSSSNGRQALALKNTNTLNRHANFNLKFSHNGKYLASAGDDGVIKIWQVISSGTERALFDIDPSGKRSARSPSMMEDYDYDSSFMNYDSSSSYNSNYYNGTNASTKNNNNNGSSKDKAKSKSERKRKKAASLFAPVFKSKPVRQFYHDDTVIDLDWSPNNFLISSSEDHTVKLWHVERDECLKVFTFPSFVSSVKFHKTDDRFFISAEYDGTIKLWSILENEVIYSKKLPNSVTCVEFTPDCDELFVGCDNGHCVLLSADELRQKALFQVSKSPRLTGIQSFDHNGDIKLLITSNDSKVRMYSYTRKTMDIRFSGYDNEYSTIMATIDDGKQYVISGSEDGWAYLWQLQFDQLDKLQAEKKGKLTWDLKSLLKEDLVLMKNKNYGAFHAHSSRCNAALFAPSATLKLLELSNDPVFDLKSKYGSIVDMRSSSKGPAGGANDEVEDLDTAVIVTTDNNGLIRVFRRDLSYSVRKHYQNNKKSMKADGRMRSMSLARNRSRSTGQSGSIFKPPAPYDLTIRADDSRGRDDFNRDSTLATKFSVESSKTLDSSNNFISTRVASTESDLKSIDAKLKELLVNDIPNAKSTGGYSTGMMHKVGPDISALTQNNRSFLNHSTSTLNQIHNNNNNNNNNNDTTITSLNGHDANGSVTPTKIMIPEKRPPGQCSYCKGTKYTAKSSDSSGPGCINFFCDNCGRIMNTK
ncbi:unnamed protein product [Ambrosiozyma monospora]|uniref:Unnamed protein product n=1 Tax=Ambrosiozyma monospora TaxID=43982 RepID=A0A9W6YN68_AMBMO|nr:unnamed protein product [Ambrosiozyma monospora]